MFDSSTTWLDGIAGVNGQHTLNRHQGRPLLLVEAGQGSCEESGFRLADWVQVLSLVAAFGPWFPCV